MAIQVEFIKRRPGGRITVRPTVYHKSDVSLGRATDCDVFLPDLRVALHHARLIHLSPNKVRIEALADYRLRVDGTLLRRRDIFIDEGADIRIGPYKLALAAGETDKDLAVSVELVEPPTAVGESADEARVFSMQGYAPDKRAGAWVLFVLIFAAFLALPVGAYLFVTGDSADDAVLSQIAFDSDQSWLSGPLSAAHANLVADCRTCHKNAFERVRDNTCLACHLGQRDHALPSELWAGAPQKVRVERWLADFRKTLDIPEGRCGSCHFEHNGANGATPASSGFCVDCHRDLDRRLPETDLVNVVNFQRLHPEFHPSVVLNPDPAAPVIERISLVDRPKEQNGLTFPHAFHLNDEEVARKLATLPDEARNRYGASLDCVDCHRADAAGALFAPIQMEIACSDCHSLAFAVDDGAVRQLPHGKPNEVRQTLNDFYLAQATALLLDDEAGSVLDRSLSEEARTRRENLRRQAIDNAQANTQERIEHIFSEDGICQKCHTVEDAGDDAAAVPAIAPVRLTNRYLPKAQFSHLQHTTGNLQCVSCHRADISDQSADVLMPGITTCRECHRDVRGATAIASDCLTCHIYHDAESGPMMTPAPTHVPLIWRTAP